MLDLTTKISLIRMNENQLAWDLAQNWSIYAKWKMHFIQVNIT